MQNRFINTLNVNDAAQLNGVKPGQWIKFVETGLRGQYMGTTRAGVTVIRWQNNSFSKKDARANKPLRAYAKIYA